MGRKLLCVLLAMMMGLGLLPAGAEKAEEMPKTGDVVEGFEVKEIRDFSLVGAKAILFEHQKTGAGLTWIANGDTNRVFDLTFFTRPTDNTGLPHVFEHSTLDGSEKWPSKALFFNLSNQTYQTYMNAMTHAAMTTYPVASLSEAQLLKLAEFYTDSCLHPMVLKDESIFREEAWRYRMADMDAELTMEGTVYSEMQGATTLERAAMMNAYRAAFPGSVVGLDQGGDPDYIPDMTWESLKNYHELFYHPSNCMVYLYGQFDHYEDFLKMLNEAFSEYEKAEFHFEDSGYTPITEPTEVKTGFPTEAGSDPANQSMMFYYIVCPGVKEDPQEELILNTLTDLLISKASPLMTGLEKALPNGTFGTYIETSAPDDAIVFYAQHVNPEDAETFRDTVNAALAEVAEKGFAQDMVDSVMASVELNMKLQGEGSDVGVNLVPTIASSCAADGDPYSYMNYVEAMGKMDEWNRQGLYQAATAKWLAGSSLTALVTTYPEPGKKEEKEAALRARLAEIKAGMTEEEKQAIVDASNATAEEEDTTDMVTSLQAVTVKSLPEEMKTYPMTDVTGEDGIRRIDAEAGVDGVGKVTLFLDAKGLKQEDLHYFHLFAALAGKLDTARHTKEELDVLTGRYLYDQEIRLSLMKSETEDYQTWLRAGWYALDEDLEAGYDLMAELLFETSFDNAEKLAERISAEKTATRAAINSSPYQVSLYRALGMESPLNRFYSYYNYIEYYQFLEETEAKMAENAAEVQEALRRVQAYFTNRTGAVVTFAGNAESIAVNRPLADAFLAKMESRPLTHEQYTLPAAAAREGLIVDSAVQFNGLVAGYKALGMEKYDASLDAVMALVSDVYLVPLLRDQYGVYTPLSGAMADGGVYLLTYRDPNIAETFEVYDSLADRIAALETDQETLDGYILSSYAGYAKNAGELSGAVNAIVALLNCDAPDLNLQRMRELKAVTPETVKASAEMFRKLSENGIRFTAGSAAAINANAEMYDTVLNPFNAQDTSSVVLEDVPEDSAHAEAVRFVMANGLMAPRSENAFGVDEAASTGDLLAAIYTAVGGPQHAPEEARSWLAGYGLVSAEQELEAPVTEQFLAELLQGAFGQAVVTVENAEATVSRGDLADLLQALFKQ